MNQRKVTLYVQSVKSPVGTERVGYQTVEVQNIGSLMPYVHIPPRTFPVYKVESAVKYEFVLPDCQKEVVEIVEAIAPKYGFEVEVVDVTRIETADKTVKKQVRELRAFPTLITDSGRKLETKFSREDIEYFLSEAARDSQDF